MKKFLALSLALLMLIAVFAACTETPTETTESETETAGETIDPNLVTLITKNEPTKYIVIYADDCDAAAKSGAQGISYQLGSKFKVEIPSYTEGIEWGCPDSSELEILVGNTTREESAETKKLLKGKKNEYAIKLFENGKIAIVASNNTSLSKATSYFISTYITGNEASDAFRLTKGLEYYYAEPAEDAAKNWKSSLPFYNYGDLAPKTYNIGFTGTFSASANSGKMQLISNTSAEDFNAYINTVKAEGFNEIAHTEVNGNLYYQFAKGNKGYYLYYTAFANEVRVIDDYSSALETNFEYSYTPKEGETAAIYQYGLMQNPTGQGGTITETKRYENNGA
jgi:hypothetical protein